MKNCAWAFASAAMALFAIAPSFGGAALAEQPRLDGISIVKIDDDAGRKALKLGPDEYLVMFISARGSYGALVSDFRGISCQSLAHPDSYTGKSIAFGKAAPLSVRRYRNQTYCPPFKVTLEGADMVLIEASTGFDKAADGREDPLERWRRIQRERAGEPAQTEKKKKEKVAFREKIVAHVPLVPLDFSGPEFTKNDFDGTALGPVKSDLHPLPLAGYSGGDRSRGFQRQPKGNDRPQAVILGKAAASQITGWPWDVLYWMQHSSKLEQLSTRQAFREAVKERYGEPSAMQEESGYSLWVYDLDGKKLDLSADTGGICRRTADFWIEYDQKRVAQKVNWHDRAGDLGPWGCSMMFELNPRRESGGVSGYYMRAASGYVMAINHFLQQVTKTKELQGKIDHLINTAAPKL